MPETKNSTLAPKAPQTAAQGIDKKTEATGTAKAADELSETDLEAVVGGWKSDKYDYDDRRDRGT